MFAGISIIVLCIGFSNSFAVNLEFGEYESVGNSWVEVTHSAENPPIWSVWGGKFLQKNYPEEWKNISSELELAQRFYKQYDIVILDLIKSDKNAEVCEGIGCLFGTYHLLISEVDYQKFKNQGFESGREGWIAGKVKGNFYDSNQGSTYEEFVILSRINGIIENLKILEGNAISLELKDHFQEQFEIQIPRSISELKESTTKNNFSILIDGEIIEHKESKQHCFYSLSIPLLEDSKFIEIFPHSGDPRIPLEIMSEPSPDCKSKIMVQEIQSPKKQAANYQEQTSEEYVFLEKDLTPEIAEKRKRLQFMETFALPLTIIITVAVISLTVFFVKKRKNKTTT